MKITRFENLECWQEARRLVKMVYDAINANKRLATDLRFSSQFSSAAEVQSLSYAALDQGYLSEGQRKAIYEQAEKVASLDSGMIKYLQRSSRSKDLKNFRPKDPKTQ